MRLTLLLLILVWISACAERQTADEYARDPAKAKPIAIEKVQTALNMDRAFTDLGLSEKMFDSCRLPVKDGTSKCGMRFFTVLNFQLTCRDTEGTTDQVVTSARPLVSNHVEYQLAGQRGILETDSEGRMQVKLVTPTSVRGQRFVVTVGKQFFGKEVDDIGQIVLPTYWCE